MLDAEQIYYFKLLLCMEWIKGKSAVYIFVEFRNYRRQ